MTSSPTLLRIPTRHKTLDEMFATAKHLDIEKNLAMFIAVEKDGAMTIITLNQLGIAEGNWLLDRAKHFVLFASDDVDS